MLAAAGLLCCTALLGTEEGRRRPPTEDGAGGACDSGALTLCADECVDLTSDLRHCGQCGNACPTSPGAVTGCVAAGEGGSRRCLTCEVSFSLCGGTCVDTRRDAHHCGACNVDCTGGTCQDGICSLVDLADGIVSPDGLVVLEDDVYWIDSNGGRGRLGYTHREGPLCAGTTPACNRFLFSDAGPGPLLPRVLTAEGPQVFTLYAGDSVVAWSRDLAASMSFYGGSGPLEASQIAVTSSSVALGLVGERGVAGGCLVLLLDRSAPLSARCLMTGDGESNLGPLVAFGRTLLAPVIRGVPSLPAGIYRIDLYGAPCAGTDCPALWTTKAEADGPTRVVVAKDWAYWITRNGEILRAGLDGTCGGGPCPEVLVRGGGSTPMLRPLAVDDTHLYWGDGRGLHRVALGASCTCAEPTQAWCRGGTCETVVPEDQRVTSLVADGKTLFLGLLPRDVSTFAGGRIARMTKPPPRTAP